MRNPHLHRYPCSSEDCDFCEDRAERDADYARDGHRDDWQTGQMRYEAELDARGPIT